MQQRFLRSPSLQILILIAAVAALSGVAQPSAASSPALPPIVLENLTDGAVPLDGSWQFHLGDNPAWAAPGFDDSQWEQLSADKPWGEQGHSSYAGFAWYRRHVVMQPAGTAPNLALIIRHIDDVYAIYWNGKLIGGNGKFPPNPVWFQFSRPPQTYGW